MDSSGAFQDFISRVRARDPEASAELVRRFEPEIRRFIRLTLRDSAELGYLDSIDISQSVFGGLFFRLVAGQFDISDPPQLLNLLRRMAKNKLADNRRHNARGRVEFADPSIWDSVPSPDEDAADSLCYEELHAEARRRLSEEERELADRRAAGKDWPQIADEVGSTPEAARKRLERAIRRVCAQLDLDAVRYESAVSAG